VSFHTPLGKVRLALLDSCIVGQAGAQFWDRRGRRSSGSRIFFSWIVVTSCLGRSVLGSCGARPRVRCVAFGVFRLSTVCAVLGPAWMSERRLRNLLLVACRPFLLGRMGHRLEWCAASGPVCHVVLFGFASFPYKLTVWVLGMSLNMPVYRFSTSFS
jgi:hypothetical protein